MTILLILICWLILTIIFLYRNEKTYRLQIEISDAAYNYYVTILKDHRNFLETLESDEELKCEKEEWYEEETKHRQTVKDSLLNRVSYEKMLFSFKPIKLESWFDPEEVQIIKMFKNNKIL